MRVLIGFLLLLTMLLAGTYAASSWLLRQLAESVLLDAGASDASLSIDYPGLETLEIRDLHVDFEGYRIQIPLLTLGYDWDFVLGQRLRSLTVPSIEIIEVEAAAPGDAVLALPAPALLWQLPIDRIAVSSIAIALAAPELTAVGAFNLDPRRSVFTLANATPGDLAGLVVSGTVERFGTISLEVLRPGQSEPAVRVEGTISAEGDARIEGKARFGADEFQLIDPRLGIDTQTADLSVGFTASYDRNGVANAAGTFGLDWQGSTADPLVVAETTLTGTFTSGEDLLFIALDDTSRALLEVPTEDPEATLAIRLTDPAELMVNHVAGQSTASGAISVSVAPVSLDGQTFAFTDGRIQLVDLSMQGAAIDLSASLDGTLHYAELTIAQHITLTTRLDGQRLQAKLGLDSHDRSLTLPVSLHHDLTTDKGGATLDTRIEIAEPLFAALWPYWSEAFDADAGVVGIAARSAWNLSESAQLSADVRVELTGVDGFVDEDRFAGLNGTLNIDYRDDQLTFDSRDLRIAAVDMGILVEQIELDVSGSDELANVSVLSGALLGGRFSSESFQYRFAQPDSRFEVRLEGIQLRDALALEGEDITGTGTLNGSVPVHIDGPAFAVAGGRLEAEPPGGVIRYAGAAAIASAAGQPGLDFALRALTDFNYQSLIATVDYATDGTLSLGVQLLGSNPAVENGRAIRYNLNVTENLPDLMTSLRLSDELTEGIQSKLGR